MSGSRSPLEKNSTRAGIGAIPCSSSSAPDKVIAGWDQGVQGMKVGGRRQLIIPPDLAYGDRGVGYAIAPGETLIFVCDLVSI